MEREKSGPRKESPLLAHSYSDWQAACTSSLSLLLFLFRVLIEQQGIDPHSTLFFNGGARHWLFVVVGRAWPRWLHKTQVPPFLFFSLSKIVTRLWGYAIWPKKSSSNFCIFSMHNSVFVLHLPNPHREAIFPSVDNIWPAAGPLAHTTLLIWPNEAKGRMDE